MFIKLIQAACVAAIGLGLLSALPTSAYAVPITSNPTLAINGMTFSTGSVACCVEIAWLGSSPAR